MIAAAKIPFQSRLKSPRSQLLPPSHRHQAEVLLISCCCSPRPIRASLPSKSTKSAIALGFSSALHELPVCLLVLLIPPHHHALSSVSIPFKSPMSVKLRYHTKHCPPRGLRYYYRRQIINIVMVHTDSFVDARRESCLLFIILTSCGYHSPNQPPCKAK